MIKFTNRLPLPDWIIGEMILHEVAEIAGKGLDLSPDTSWLEPLRRRGWLSPDETCLTAPTEAWDEARRRVRRKVKAAEKRLP